jgi:hypothetical protein
MVVLGGELFLMSEVPLYHFLVLHAPIIQAHLVPTLDTVSGPEGLIQARHSRTPGPAEVPRS